MAKARAAASGESLIRAPFARSAGAKRWLRAAEVTGRRGRASGGRWRRLRCGWRRRAWPGCWTRGRWRSRARRAARWRCPGCRARRRPAAGAWRAAQAIRHAVGAQGGVRGALPGMALKQSRRRADEGGEEHAAGPGEIQGPPDGVPGGSGVAGHPPRPPGQAANGGCPTRAVRP